MNQIAALGRAATVPASSDPPDRVGQSTWRSDQARRWDGVSVAVFRGGAGGRGPGASPAPWHRILLSPALVGPVALKLDGGPTRRFMLEPGTIGFHPAGAEVSLHHGPGQVIQVLQDPLLYRRLLADIGGGGELEAEPLINFVDPLVAQIARSLASEAGSGPADRLLVDGLSMALAVRIARRFAPRKPRSGEGPGLPRGRLRRVLDHVEAHLGEEMTLAELAGIACLSPFHFSRCFKRTVGVGPQRYVLRRRIERAREMIRRTDEPLASVAQALGFADQSHFTKAFRRETGLTPARFRAAAA
jgi:AraC family transcriptional regulator